jgi:hypothetical protein
MPLYLLGAILICVFFVVRLGLIKSWFVLKTLPGLLSARMIYTLLPLGITFIAGGIAATVSETTVMDPNQAATNFLLVYCPFLIVGFLFMVWTPNWIKPVWLRWLEQEYGYCLDILIEEAQKMNRWDWEARVRTQKGMQMWIDEVFAHRRAEIEQRWIDEIKDYVPEHRRRKNSVPYPKKGRKRKRR